MPILAGVLTLSLLLIVQSAVTMHALLLEGAVDLVLVAVISWSLIEHVRSPWIWAIIAGGLMALTSAVPPWAPVSGFLLVTGWGMLLRRRTWQIPLIALLVATVTGTLLYQGITYLALRISGWPLPLGETFALVTLPAVLLNLLAALPIRGLVNEIANWVYPDLEDI